jgi:hypothetical protein
MLLSSTPAEKLITLDSGPLRLERKTQIENLKLERLHMFKRVLLATKRAELLS